MPVSVFSGRHETKSLQEEQKEDQESRRTQQQGAPVPGYAFAKAGGAARLHQQQHSVEARAPCQELATVWAQGRAHFL